MIGAEEAATRDLVALGVGALLLLIYAGRVARGKDPLRCGPSPEARFTFLDALAVYLVALLASVLLSAASAELWPDDVGNRYLFSYLGPIPVAAAAFFVYVRQNPVHGPRVRGAIGGALAWLAWFPVVFAVFAATQELWEAAGWKWVDQRILEDLRTTAPWKFFLSAVILAPLYEETVFRGMVYPAIRRRLPRGAAILATSAFFAVVHMSPAHIPALFVLSLALTWVYERTGTLAAPIAFHAAFNGWTFLSEMLKAGGS